MTTAQPFTLGKIIDRKPTHGHGQTILFKRENAPLPHLPYATIWMQDGTGVCLHGHYDMTESEARQDFDNRV